MAGSPQQDEVLRLKVDAAEAEAAIGRLEQRWDELQRVVQAGGDGREQAQAVQQEAAQLGEIAGRSREAGTAVEELVRQKGTLAAVLNLVGAQAGPVVGQLGQVAALLAAGGPVAAGMVATAAAVGLVVAALREMATASAEAREAEERRLAQAQGAKDRDVAATLAMAERMGRSGGGPEAISAAVAMREQLRGLAITGAEDVIPAIIAAGVSDRDEAARVALLARSGASITNAESVRRALERNPAEADALLERQRAFAASDVGRLIAAGPGVQGMPSLTDDEIAFRRLRDTGQLPPGVGSVEQMRRRLDVIERLSPALGGDARARLRRDELTAAGFKLGGADWFPGVVTFGADAISDSQWEETVRLRAARERVLGGVPERSVPAPPVVIQVQQSVGSVHYYDARRSGRESGLMLPVQDGLMGGPQGGE